jgi:hypothetical protein
MPFATGDSRDMAAASVQLRRSDPSDPQRAPHTETLTGHDVGDQRRTQVCGKLMHHSTGYSLAAHTVVASPWPSRMRISPTQEVPRHHRRDAPRPAQIRQIRAGIALRSVTTPVPRVLLSTTLTGPTPSGSAGAPALSGLLRPSPAPPGSGRPRLRRTAATLRRCDAAGLSPPLEQQRLTAHETSAPSVHHPFRGTRPAR